MNRIPRSARRAVVVLVAVAVAGAAGWLAVVALDLVGEPEVADLRLEPVTVTGCLPVEGTVTLTGTAPDGGAVVDLAVTSAVARAPAQATVPGGTAQVSFPLDTDPVPAPERVEVGATLGRSTVTAPLEVRPVEAAALGADPSPACLAGFTEHHGYGQPERAGSFDAEQIPEASGLAASRRHPGWLYVVDDEQPSEVWAMRTDGTGAQPIALEGFVGRDTEALAVGPCGPDDPATCVYVGDIGDNFHRYPDVAILRFPEPDLSAPVPPVEPDVIRVRYPDGPVDAEALVVDEAGALYVVTKEGGPEGRGAARLFTREEFSDGTLTALGPIPVPEPSLPLVAGFLGVVVTGGDHRDGRVLLRTYDHAVEYVAPDPAAPVGEFPTWPAREVPAAREPQSEAIAYAADGCGYYTVGEMVGDIWFVGCRR